MYRELSAPVSVQVELVSACQFKCVHCYNHWRGRAGAGHRLTETQAISIVDELLKNRVFEIVFTGGEPLLNKPALFAALERLREKRAEVSIGLNSNLSGLTPADASRLFDLGIKGVLTSFASGDEAVNDQIMRKRGAWERILSGIKVAQAAGIKVACSMVVSRFNRKDLVATGRFLQRYGINQFYATKCSPPANCPSPKELMISREGVIDTLEGLLSLQGEGLLVGILECYPLCGYRSQPRYPFAVPHRCSAGITTCTIGSDGQVRPCSHSDETYGDIFHERLRAIWKKMSEWRDGSRLPSVCKECDLFSVCSGGCRVDAKTCFGSISALDPYADPSAIGAVELADESPEELSLSSMLEVADFVSRKEGRAVLCASRTKMNGPALVTKDTLELLIELKGRLFTVSEFLSILQESQEEGMAICRGFLADGLFRLVTGGLV